VHHGDGDKNGVEGEPVSGNISDIEPALTETPEISTLPVRIDTIFVDNTPVTIIRTVEKERVFIPFVSASYNTWKQGGIGGGLFYHDIGIQVRYITDFKAKGLDLSVMYKF
jgi:hypothetical protein